MVSYRSSKLFKNVRKLEQRDPFPHEVNKLAKMHKRIARLVITDFVCWIPLCIISFCSLAGMPTPQWLYSFTIVILLPINSALNPLLYSDVIANLFKHIKIRFALSSGNKEFNESAYSTASNNISLSHDATTSIQPIGKTNSLKSNENAKTLATELNKEFQKQSLSKRFRQLVTGKRSEQPRSGKRSSRECCKPNASVSGETMSTYISVTPCQLRRESTV